MNKIADPSPLVHHLLELRNRLLRCIIVLVVLFVALAPFAGELYTWVAQPLQKYLGESNSSMISIDIVAPVFIPFKLAFFLAFLLSVPLILHQAWSFLAPALYSHEKRLVVPLLLSSVVLFYLGIAFAYYVLFPLAFGFFTTFAPEGVKVMTDIEKYYDFVFKVFIAFGIAFEIPIATVLLIRSGVVSVESLEEKRPYIVIGCFIAGMFLTPPDIFSQVLLALPMWFLFECGIFFGKRITPKASDHPDE